MNIHRAVIFIVGLTAFAGCSHDSTEVEVVGVYAADGADLSIARDGDRLIATVSGNRTGTGTAADCEVRAVGRLDGHTLAAEFISFDSETFAYDERSAASEARQLEIAFDGDRASVNRIDIDAYCGVGAQLVGDYHRRGPD